VLLVNQPDGVSLSACRAEQLGDKVAAFRWVAFLAEDLAGPAERRVRRLGQVELEVVHLRDARAEAGSAPRPMARGAALQPSLDIRACALGQLLREHIAHLSVVGQRRG
jgi:hypothetical protein